MSSKSPVNSSSSTSSFLNTDGIDHQRQIDNAELIKQLKNERARCEGLERELDAMKKLLSDHQSSIQDDLRSELETMRDKLLTSLLEKVALETELVKFKKLGQESTMDIKEDKLVAKQPINGGSSLLQTAKGIHQSISDLKINLPGRCQEGNNNINNGPVKIPAQQGLPCEEVGFEKVLSMLCSEDILEQIHAVKVVANLAADDMNQERIVNDGGLDALLMILRTSQNTTILKVASCAIANLAMHEINQGLIMNKGGAQLLSSVTSKTDDPQTLRMVGGAIANLCGNVTVHMILKQDGCIKALLEMSRYNNAEVLVQVARGFSNFAKCETRHHAQGYRKGPSLLTDEGVLTWLIENSKDNLSDSIRRHIELALCHLASNEDNTQDFISCGGLEEVIRISQKSSREDIRDLAKKTLRLNPIFEVQMSVDANTL